MTNTQKNYLIKRIDEIIHNKIVEIQNFRNRYGRLCNSYNETEAIEILEGINFSIDIKAFKKNFISKANEPNAFNNIFDNIPFVKEMQKRFHEILTKENEKYQKLYAKQEEIISKIRNDARALQDKIILGDEKEAVKLLEEFINKKYYELT